LRDAHALRDLFLPNRIERLTTDKSVLQRTSQVSALHEVEEQILKDGFRGQHVDLDVSFDNTTTLTRLFGIVLQYYGLKVFVPKHMREQELHDLDLRWAGKPYHFRSTHKAAGLWTGGQESAWPEGPWQKSERSFWSSADKPNERHDPEHLQALAVEATGHGVDPDRPRTDPVMHALLTGLVYGRQLVDETQHLQALPPAPGLMPPAQERLARVAPLNRLAVAVLEDAIHPGSLTRVHVVAELSPVVRAYGLRITEV
jgi:hypothetical protein